VKTKEESHITTGVPLAKGLITLAHLVLSRAYWMGTTVIFPKLAARHCDVVVARAVKAERRVNFMVMNVGRFQSPSPPALYTHRKRG
jgi:hypothetical protein